MSSVYGEHLKLSIFGQSHGPAIGMTLDGIPAGLPIDMEKLQQFMKRRAPGQNAYSTPRKEKDIPEFLDGIVNGKTCGSPITAVIYNQNQRSSDYNNLLDSPRPGHADYTAHVKYGGSEEITGGGHFSGRLTAPLCIAGGMCMQWLEKLGIRIGAHIQSIGNIADSPILLDWLDPDLESICSDFPVVNPSAGERMQQRISVVKADGDSIGGIIECFVTGIPAGIGGPMFGGMESRLSQILYGIPAVKGVSFGSGFGVGIMLGSENNDPYAYKNGSVVTTTNHCGGILGGITTGMPLVLQVAVKPTPSISKPQTTISYTQQTTVPLEIKGRHDPCIVPRAVPVVEAAVAVALYDAILGKG